MVSSTVQISELRALGDLIQRTISTIEQAHDNANVPLPTVSALKSINPKAEQAARSLAGDRVLSKATSTLVSACHQLSASVQSPQDYLYGLTLGMYDLPIIATLIEAGLPEIMLELSLNNGKLSQTGVSVSALSKRCGIEEKKLARLLRYLATRHVFCEPIEDHFSHNRASFSLLKDSFASPSFGIQHFYQARMGGASIFASTLLDPETGPSYEARHAPSAIAQGWNGDIFSLLATQPKRRANFSAYMKAYSEAMSGGPIASFPWSSIQPSKSTGKVTLVDVGGNQGGAALSISSRPETQGWKFIVQDRPEVIATKDEIWTEEKKKQVEVEFMAHDFLEVQPVVGAEIYWMRQILHDWNDEVSATILSQVVKSMSSSSKLLIVDRVIRCPLPSDSTPGSDSILSSQPFPLLANGGYSHSSNVQMDIHMMNALSASERSVSDFVKLTSSVGLKIVGIWESGSMPAVIECMKVPAHSMNGSDEGSDEEHANGLVSVA